MGRPLKTAEIVSGALKVGAIGDTALAGNQIQFNGFITGGSAKAGSAIAQKGTRTFKITTADGTADLFLVAKASGSLLAGECQITATDSAGGTYYVNRISANNVTIGALGTGTQFAVGTKVPWVFVGPVLNTSVALAAA